LWEGYEDTWRNWPGRSMQRKSPNCDYLEKHPVAALTSFSVVVLRKPS
jgi:hypothetical protein